MKICSTLFKLREMPIKTTLNYYFPHNQFDITLCRGGYEKRCNTRTLKTGMEVGMMTIEGNLTISTKIKYWTYTNAS